MSRSRNHIVVPIGVCAIALFVAPCVAPAGPAASSAPSGSATGLSTYGRPATVMGPTGWPTVYTNTQSLGICYGWGFPYYPSPYSCRPDPYVGWGPGCFGGPGYAPYWPRLSPGTPFLWTNSPCYWPRTYDGPPLVEIARRVDPALLNLPTVPAPPPPKPPTLQEMAQAAMAARDYQRAALIYARLGEEQRTHESNEVQPQSIDRTAEFMRALALSGARLFSEAASLLAQTTRGDPNPPMVDAAALIPTASEMRRIITSAVAWAHSENTPDAWRLVAFLMASEGRIANAERMLERADSLERPAPGTRPSPIEAQPVPGPAGYSMPAPEPPVQQSPAQPDR